MAWTQGEFNLALVDSMVDNSPYPQLAGEPMPQSMRNTMVDSMYRLGTTIYSMTASWALGLEGGEFPNDQVRLNIDDITPNFLGNKIDDITLKVNDDNTYIYVDSVPPATIEITGGFRAGGDEFLYMDGELLLLNADFDPILSGGDSKVPTSRAVKLFVASAIQGINIGGGSGDMLKSTYDTLNTGVVDDSERLNNELPSYYLNWNNFSNTPTTIGGYGILDSYIKSEIDGFFEVENLGKKQISWTNVISKPPITTISNQGNDRVMTSDGTTSGLVGEASLTFNGTLLTVGGNEDVTGILSVDTIQEYTTSNGVSISSDKINLNPTGSSFNIEANIASEVNGKILKILSGSTTAATLPFNGGNLIVGPGQGINGGTNGSIFIQLSSGTAALVNDNTESNLVAYDTATGLLSYRSVASVDNQRSIGTVGQVAITNAAADDFYYTDALTYDISNQSLRVGNTTTPYWELHSTSFRWRFDSIVSGTVRGFSAYSGTTTYGMFGFHAINSTTLLKAFIGKSSSDTSAEFYLDGSVNLYYNDVLKFQTTSDGIYVDNTVLLPLGGQILFGDLDTSIRESVDDVITIKVLNVDRYNIDSTGIYVSTTGAAPIMIRGLATSTVPTFAFTNSLTTGMGLAAINQLSLIANGVESMKLESTKVTSNVDLDVTGNIDAHTYTGTTYQIVASADITHTPTDASHIQFHAYTASAAQTLTVNIDLDNYETNDSLPLVITGQLRIANGGTRIYVRIRDTANLVIRQWSITSGGNFSGCIVKYSSSSGVSASNDWMIVELSETS